MGTGEVDLNWAKRAPRLWVDEEQTKSQRAPPRRPAGAMRRRREVGPGHPVATRTLGFRVAGIRRMPQDALPGAVAPGVLRT